MSLNHANTLSKTVGQSVFVKTNKMIKITDGWKKKDSNNSQRTGQTSRDEMFTRDDLPKHRTNTET